MGRGQRQAVVLLVAMGIAGPARSPALASDGAARPTRIVSLNLCTDELLLRLVDRDRIASVTSLSQDPRESSMAAEARSLPANHGLAEEVLAFRPDLVVAGRYTARAAVAILRRAGIPVVEFDVPNDVAAVEAQMRAFAALVGEPGRGEALVTDMERQLTPGPDGAGAARPRAFVLRPNGFTDGRGSLVDDLLTRAGLDNLAGRLGLGGFAQVPLERIVLEGVDLLVVDGDRAGPPSLATEILHHPVFAKLERRVLAVSVPSRLWTCAGPGIVEAVQRLREAADALRGRAAP